MTELDKFLERVAKVVQTDVIGHRPDGDGNPPGTEDRLMKEAVKGVLDAYILPLLEAGQAMRGCMEGMLSRQGVLMEHTLEGQNCVAWDKQKQAAMEGK